MKLRAVRLTKYCKDRLDDSLRAVGYYSENGAETTFVREDVEALYGPQRIKQFVQSSQSLHSDLQRLDQEMGSPEASLHVLTDGLIVQFHFGKENIVFLAMERDVGRNFVTFVEECQERMG